MGKAWRRTPLFGRSPNGGQRGEAALWRVLAADGNARVRRPYGDISLTSQKRTESNMTGTPKSTPREEPRSARLFVGARRGFQFLREPRNAGGTPRPGGRNIGGVDRLVQNERMAAHAAVRAKSERRAARRSRAVARSRRRRERARAPPIRGYKPHVTKANRIEHDGYAKARPS